MSSIQQSGGSSSSGDWTYLTLTMPTGSAEALWQFDDTASDLLDRTINGHNLTLTAGVELHSLNNGLVGLGFAGTSYYTAASPTNLRALGDLTIEVEWQRINIATRTALVICAGDTLSETEANNILYALILETNHSYYYQCEYNLGTNVNDASSTLPTLGAIELVTMTRNGTTGDLNWYQNGRLMDTALALHLPSGGGSATVVIGWDKFSATPYLYGVIYSMRISKVCLTDAQVLSVYESIAPR